jgi:hypothetical protein
MPSGVLTWQVVNGVAVLLPADLRVSNPANLDMTHVVYEAPQNAHRTDVYVQPVRTPASGDAVHGPGGLASTAVPGVLTPPDGSRV